MNKTFQFGNIIQYKTTSISKQNFAKILGEEGSIKIINQNGEEIGEINKETKEDENGFYTYTYENETTGITIKTSKPINEGTLKIKHQKAIQAQESYDENSLKAINRLQQTVKTGASTTKLTIEPQETTKTINLINPATKIETSIDRQELSTIVANENVQIKTILKTNDLTCDLYKNPRIEIELPNFVEQIELKDVNLLYDDELKIKDYKSYVNDRGTISIEITLEGENTKYNLDNISKGANINITANIKLKDLTPTTESVIKTYITNEKATSYETSINPEKSILEQQGYIETYVKAVAPVGMVTTNEITGYNNKGETAMSISGKESVGKLDVGQGTKQATVTMNIINNYEASAKNIQILGTLPCTGNKDVDTKENLESNITASLESFLSPTGIDEKNVEIYYSENAESTKELENARKWLDKRKNSKHKNIFNKLKRL